MPQLSDLIEKKKFVKKSYRPWDLSGTGTVDSKEPINTTTNLEKNLTTSPEATSLEEIISAKEHNTIIEFTSAAIDKVSGNITGNITDNKQGTNREQTDNNEITSDNKRDNIQVTNREQTDNITGNVTGNTNGLIYLIETIKKLGGIQKNIFMHLINICTARGALDTGNILSSDLANAAKCTVGSAKTSLIRLIEKHLVIRLPGKACRGGHMVLGITKEIQAAAIQAQLLLFNPLNMSSTDNVTGNTTGNMSMYSSSSYKNNNNTTTLPEEWKKVNFEPLQDIGFSETQLRQLFESSMTTPEIVQDAINRFAYSLEHTDKAKAYSDPLNVIMGVLRKGQRWIESNYIPPKELALQQILEEKRKRKQQVDEMIKELIELEFPEWRRRLTDAEIEAIVPVDVRKTNLTAAVQAVLRTYFTEKVLLPRLELNGMT